MRFPFHRALGASTVLTHPTHLSPSLPSHSPTSHPSANPASNPSNASSPLAVGTSVCVTPCYLPLPSAPSAHPSQPQSITSSLGDTNLLSSGNHPTTKHSAPPVTHTKLSSSTALHNFANRSNSDLLQTPTRERPSSIGSSGSVKSIIGCFSTYTYV